MKGQKVVVGVFTYLDDALKGIQVAKDNDKDYQVYAPTYVPALVHAVDSKRSKIAMISLTGGICGLIAGFALAILTGLDWPMRVSAKNIVSIPAYIVVGYEWTILWGALFTLNGMLLLCRIPNPFRKVGYDPRFSDDKYGVVIGCEPDQVDQIKEKLAHTGADEVMVKEGL